MTLLTEKETALRLGVNPKTLGKWRSRGYGPPVVRVGRGVRYWEEKLEAWLDAQTEQPGGGEEAKVENSRTSVAGGALALSVQGKQAGVQRKHRLGGYETKRQRRAGDSGAGETKNSRRGITAPGDLPIQ